MIGPFTIDTYLPSFPALGRDLAATPAQLQQTLSVYFLTFAIMTLFHGTLSDSFGRRPVILASLVIYIVASIGCAAASDFGQLLLFRILQGTSAGAGMIVGRAVIRDSFEGHAAQRLMSLVTMIFGLAPAIARSFTVPFTASAPMSPPGNTYGLTTYESVVNAKRTPPSSRTAASCRVSREGLRNAGKISRSSRSCIIRPPPPWASAIVSRGDAGNGQENEMSTPTYDSLDMMRRY